MGTTDVSYPAIGVVQRPATTWGTTAAVGGMLAVFALMLLAWPHNTPTARSNGASPQTAAKVIGQTLPSDPVTTAKVDRPVPNPAIINLRIEAAFLASMLPSKAR